MGSQMPGQFWLRRLVSGLGALWFLLAGAAAAAQQGDTTLQPLAPTTAQLAAFVDWHGALITNNFDAYLRLNVQLPGVTKDVQRQAFAEQVKSVPADVKISQPENLSNGGVKFYALGCKEGVRRVAIVTVSSQGGSWRVLSTAWAPPWNDKAKACPV